MCDLYTFNMYFVSVMNLLQIFVTKYFWLCCVKPLSCFVLLRIIHLFKVWHVNFHLFMLTLTKSLYQFYFPIPRIELLKLGGVNWSREIKQKLNVTNRLTFEVALKLVCILFVEMNFENFSQINYLFML